MASPADVDESSGHGALFAVLVALDGDAVEVASLPSHPASCVHVLAHHDLAKDLHATAGAEEKTMQNCFSALPGHPSGQPVQCWAIQNPRLQAGTSIS